MDRQRELERLLKEAESRERAGNYSNKKMAMKMAALEETASRDRRRLNAAHQASVGCIDGRAVWIRGKQSGRIKHEKSAASRGGERQPVENTRAWLKTACFRKQCLHLHVLSMRQCVTSSMRTSRATAPCRQHRKSHRRLLV